MTINHESWFDGFTGRGTGVEYDGNGSRRGGNDEQRGLVGKLCTQVGGVDSSETMEATNLVHSETTEGQQDKSVVPSKKEGTDSSEEEPEPVQEVFLKEWRQLHDDWLHAAMQAAMGDNTLKSIPDIDMVKHVD